jgi:hypothetical protein
VEDQVKSMGYRQAIIDRLDRQTAKGIAKYGGPIDKSGHLTSAEEALEYLAEELTDGLVYVEHVKALIRQLVEENQRLRQAEATWALSYRNATGCCSDCKEREKKLVEALRWYADERNHLATHFDAGETYVGYDGGQRARDTLKELGIE